MAKVIATSKPERRDGQDYNCCQSRHRFSSTRQEGAVGRSGESNRFTWLERAG